MAKVMCVLLAVALIVPVSAARPQVPSGRQVVQMVQSAADPAMDITIDPSFSFLGRTSSLVMDKQATAEQFWFVKSSAGQITRAVVVHFEHWNAGVEGAFNYPTSRVQKLGGHDYLHQSFPMAGCELVTPDVKTLLRAASLTFAPHCIATRFVRAASMDKRSEVIFFYVEPVDALPFTEGLGPGGIPVGHDLPNPPKTPWSAVDQRLTDEALKAISVRDR